MVKFNLETNNYSDECVSEFVKEITVEYELLLNKLKICDTENKVLKEELEKYKNVGSTLSKTLIVATDEVSKLKKDAYTESKKIIDDAHIRADEIIKNALLSKEKIDEEVNISKQKAEIFKKKYRQLVEETLSVVEKFDDTI